jgi:cytochrome c-type biogenesis protein CcmH
MMRFVFLFLLFTGAAFAARAPETLPDPVQEAHARILQREFRCLVCQGESIDESSAPLAADLRRLIREHIARGETDAQIRQYLVARYGAFILMKPPVEPDTYVLWLVPVVTLVLAGAGAALVILRASRRVPLEDRNITSL